MLRALAALALAFGLGACLDPEPTFDTSSAQACAASLQRINDHLSTERRKALRAALLTLAASAGQAGGDEDTVARDFLKLALVANPTLAAGWLVTSLGEEIHGMTASQVILRAHAAEIIQLEGRIGRIEQRIADLADQLVAAGREAAGQDRALQAVAVTDARFGWAEDAFAGKPVIEFRLTNGLEVAIVRAVFRGVLSAPERSRPLAEDRFERRFRPGLAAGAQTHVRLLPNRFGAWSDRSLGMRPDAVLSVRLLEIETATGVRLRSGDAAASGRLHRKLEQLEASRDRLRRRLERLRELADAA